MSIEYELFKNVGKTPCAPNSLRPKKCPLVMNAKSEDLLFSNVFGRLKYLDPEIWLIPLLEFIFTGRKFTFSLKSKIKIEFWKKLPPPPGAEYQEGIPEIDIVIRFGRFIILIECKYRSSIQGESATGLKRDPVLRYLDSAIYNYWPDSGTNCEIFFVLLTNLEDEPAILSQYRNPDRIFAGLTQARPFINYEGVSKRLAKNIGHVRWRDLLRILESQDAKRLTSIEGMVVSDLIAYLRYKLQETKQSRNR